MTRKKMIQIIAGLVLVLLFGIKGAFVKNPILSGDTMGTRYSVTLSGYLSRNAISQLQRQIDTQLIEVNRQMSTWDADSEISRFNQAVGSTSFETSKGFATVVGRALDLSASTGGAFDPTLQPLLNLWGFGSGGNERTVPTDAEIAKTKAQTGWRKVRVEEGSKLWKSDPDIQLALGAIAKGYGADVVGQWLDEKGYENWFVEIGGEVVVRGLNPDKVPWRIGIQTPTTNPVDQSLQGIVHLSGGAVATSGDYRNYIIEDDVIYSHILDPRSGRAVLSDTASVTVVAPLCMDADGIATALFVMGADEGRVWVEQRPGVEALFLVRTDEGEIIEKFSSGFKVTTSYTVSF